MYSDAFPQNGIHLLKVIARRPVGPVVETIVILFIMRVSLLFGAKSTNVSSFK
jgi:hypothetical protein